MYRNKIIELFKIFLVQKLKRQMALILFILHLNSLKTCLILYLNHIQVYIRITQLRCCVCQNYEKNLNNYQFFFFVLLKEQQLIKCSCPYIRYCCRRTANGEVAAVGKRLQSSADAPESHAVHAAERSSGRRSHGHPLACQPPSSSASTGAGQSRAGPQGQSKHDQHGGTREVSNTADVWSNIFKFYFIFII